MHTRLVFACVRNQYQSCNDALVVNKCSKLNAIMGTSTLALVAFAIFMVVYTADAAGSCPLASKVYSCSPKCQQNYDCSHGKICCPNSCNAKSCIESAAFGSSGANDKRSQSGGPGVYCNNVKCSAFEVCKMDPATKRMKCMRA